MRKGGGLLDKTKYANKTMQFEWKFALIWQRMEGHIHIGNRVGPNIQNKKTSMRPSAKTVS